MCGIVGANPDMAGKFAEYGFSWIAVGSDLAYVVTRGTEYLAKMRGIAPVAAAKTQSAY
jgi:2-dehydro-3-deoxyglucarate aldolase/4-hydroxy-2-oxoheptanedioate aldolase